ncbi:MAG: type III pantothenate kinase [Pseudomonadota bacterium]|nr:type III pantothenate kinase [Pseudomonadota bacterium]MEC8725924.1 type III pantothenate kinase [Pseudomonadota bacterium]|tara:strand:- start:401 stop:1174 length:774 start_codon:yes stop_codon:yes gene_type:complete
MLLTIDSGNTNIVFALYEAGKQRGVWRRANDNRQTADEYGVWLLQLMALAKLHPEDVDSAIIATVVPDTLFSLKGLCRNYFKAEPLVVGDAGVELGIQALVDTPEAVGADRLVNAVAAHEEYGGPLIILDFGTATTFDVINADGDYVGGVIAPGINLSVEALHRAAAMLPKVSVTRPQTVIGKHTTPAMQSGVYWGYVGLIEGLVERIRNEYGEKLRVVATGGLAPMFEPAVDVIQEVDRNLTLRGLVSIYSRNAAA